MAFDITMYQTISEKNRVTKTLTNAITLTGTLRDEASVISPVVDVQATTITSNYAYIQATKRYYYITDVVSVRNGLFRLQLKVDVLMSNATEIKQLRAIVERQENVYNLNLADNNFSVECGCDISTVQYAQGFNDENTFILITNG